MNQSTKAFSLIEVIIAASILSIAIFWVYKLIGENTKLISNNDNYLQANYQLQNITKCIDYFWETIFDTGSTQEYSINFGSGNTECLTGSYNTSFDFTGVTIDGIEYSLFMKTSATGSNYIDWEIGSFWEGVGKITTTYRQIQ